MPGPLVRHLHQSQGWYLHAGCQICCYGHSWLHSISGTMQVHPSIVSDSTADFAFQTWLKKILMDNSAMLTALYSKYYNDNAVLTRVY